MRPDLKYPGDLSDIPEELLSQLSGYSERYRHRGTPRIDVQLLDKILAGQITQSEAARNIGTSRQRIHQYLEKYRRTASRITRQATMNEHGARTPDEAWNAALEAAVAAIEQAPVFGKGDSVIRDAANIRSLSICMDQIRALARKPKPKTAADRTAVPHDQREPEPFNRG